jgi:hypothetical protein
MTAPRAARVSREIDRVSVVAAASPPLEPILLVRQATHIGRTTDAVSLVNTDCAPAPKEGVQARVLTTLVGRACAGP